jgi:hypothetical protein
MLTVVAGLATMLPLQASFAEPSFMSKLSSYCASLGKTSYATSCAVCHTGATPNEDNANTSSARQYEAGNYASFCIGAGTTPSTPPVATPPPVVRPTPRARPSDDERESSVTSPRRKRSTSHTRD